MGYFEGCVDGMFKKNQDGQYIFHPYGIMSRGYILKSEEHYQHVRDFEIKVLKIMIFFSWALPIMLLIAIWKVWHTYKITARLERTNERLKMADLVQNSFTSHSLFISIICFFISIGYVFGGLYIIFIQTNVPREIASVTYAKFGVNVFAAISILFFALCSFLWGQICIRKLFNKKN